MPQWLLERFEDLLSWIAGVSVFAMMILVSADAASRYAFNAPIAFQFDFTTNYLMVIVGTLALSWGERNGAMIKIRAGTRVLPSKFHAPLYAFNNALAGVVFGMMTVAATIRTVDAYASADVIFGVIDWPVWLSLVWVPIGAGALTLRLLFNAVQFAFLGRPVVWAKFEDEV